MVACTANNANYAPVFNTLEMLLWRILIQVFIKSLIISWCFYLIKKHSQELLKSEADLEGSVRDVLTISAFVCL